MALKDLKALRGMSATEVFEDEIFGFHVQQSIEKTLKAWLAFLGIEYPLTHDLSILLNSLRNNGVDVDNYWDLVEYNAFAATIGKLTGQNLGKGKVESPLKRSQ